MKLRPTTGLEAYVSEGLGDDKADPEFFTDVPFQLTAKVLNPHLKRYIAEEFFSHCHPKERVNRRIDEFNGICRVLVRSGHNPDLLQKLLNCNKKRPSNLMLSPYCRQMRVEHDVRRMNAAFANVPDHKIYFFTGIAAVLYGTPQQVEKQAKQLMPAIRRKLRNHHEERAKKRAWYKDIVMCGYFEIELYRYRRSHKEAAEEGLDVNTKRKMRKNRRKYRLSRKLGFDPKRDEDFFVLHWHCLAYIPKLKSYERGLRRKGKGLFPYEHQLDFSRHRSIQDRADRFRILASYMVKAAARSGRLFGRRRPPILPTKPLLNFVDLYSTLNYKNLSFNFGTATRLD